MISFSVDITYLIHLQSNVNTRNEKSAPKDTFLLHGYKFLLCGFFDAAAVCNTVCTE